MKVDHSTIARWVLAYAPELEKWINPRLKPTNDSWRVEKRVLFASTDLNAYLDWSAVGQVLYLERQVLRLKTGRVSTERVIRDYQPAA